MANLVRALLLASIAGPAAFAAEPTSSGSETLGDTPWASLEARINRLEQENDFLKSHLSRPQTIVKQGSKFLGTDKHVGWIGGLDYLHMAYRQPGLEYGITDIGGVQDRGAVGSVIAMEGDYDGGWRASLGYRFNAEDCNCAFNRPELLFSYTNFDTEQDDRYIGSLRATFISSDNSENDDSDNINTLGVETITPDDRATSATAALEFNYEVIDSEIAQSFALTKTLNLRMSAIARYARLDEDFRVTYTGGDFQVPYTAFRNWDYQGGGLLIGSQLDWRLTNRFSLSAGGKAGMMLGRRESRHFFPDDEPGVPTDVRSNTTRATTVVEMSAMVNYTRDFGGFELNIGGGYELKNWFDMADNRVFTDSHMEGQNTNTVRDLTLDGLVGRISINY